MRDIVTVMEEEMEVTRDAAAAVVAQNSDEMEEGEGEGREVVNTPSGGLVASSEEESELGDDRDVQEEGGPPGPSGLLNPPSPPGLLNPPSHLNPPSPPGLLTSSSEEDTDEEDDDQLDPRAWPFLQRPVVQGTSTESVLVNNPHKSFRRPEMKAMVIGHGATHLGCNSQPDQQK